MKYLLLTLLLLVVMIPVISADITTAEVKIDDLAKKIDTVVNTGVTKEEFVALEKKMDSFVTREELAVLDKKIEQLLAQGEPILKSTNKGSMIVHGTEYTYGQTAKVWLQLLNSTGSSVDNGVCYTDIYTPLAGYFVERALMTNMAHDGIYYYDFAVPARQGVYPVIATCYYVASQNPRLATSFALTSGSVSSGTYTDTQTLNTVYHVVDTNKNGGLTVNNRVNVTYNFSDFYTQCGNVSELLITGLSIYWNGIWNTGTANHDVIIYIYNYTSNTWITFSSKILGGSGGSTQIVTNSISTTNFTTALGITSTKQMRIRLADTDINEGAKKLSTDYLYASCDQLSSPEWQSVKGSSELHITSDLFYTVSTDNVYNITNGTVYTTLWNGTTRSLIYYTGIFTHEFIISAAVLANKSILIEYQGMHSIPCNAFLDLYLINSTGYYPYPFTTQSQTQEGHCSINIPINATPGETYTFQTHLRNVWESDTRSTNTGFGAVYPLINAGCLLWQQVKGYPAYITPKNKTHLEYDYYYRACSNWYDDYYWFNQTYTTTNVNKYNITDELSYLQYEANYHSLKFAEDKLNALTTSLIQNLLASGQYSKLLLDNPLGNLTNTTDQQYWGSHSTIYENWQMLNASCGNGTCKINNTAVADSVWSYNGTVSDNILVQFATKIWNWLYRYTHGVTI